MLVEGRASGFVMLLALCITGIYSIMLSKKWKPTFRSIPGLLALDDAVGRATEMGRPVHFTSGLSTLDSTLAPQIIAGMSVLEHLARKCAINNTRLIVSLGHADVIPLATEIMREAAISVGAPEQFREQDITYYSNQEFPYCVGVQGAIEREKPAANIMVGPFYGDQIAFAEIGYRVGAIQIGGTARIVQIPFFAVVCDYTLIGEEIFAVGAFLSQDPIQLASITAQDVFKFVAVFLIILGVALTSVGNSMIQNILIL